MGNTPVPTIISVLQCIAFVWWQFAILHFKKRWHSSSGDSTGSWTGRCFLHTLKNSSQNGSLQLSPPRSHLLIHNPWTQIHAISPCHLRNSNRTVFSKDRNIFNSYLNTFFRLTFKVYPHFTYTHYTWSCWRIHKAADRPTFGPTFNILWSDCLRSYTFTHEFLAYKVSMNQKGKNEINIFLHDLLQVTDRS